MCVCTLAEDVRGQPLHRPSDRPRVRPAALRPGVRRPHLGGWTRSGRGLHHLHRHRYPSVQKVSVTLILLVTGAVQALKMLCNYK